MIDEDGVAMEKPGVTWSPGLLLSGNVDPGHKDNEQVCGTDLANYLSKGHSNIEQTSCPKNRLFWGRACGRGCSTPKFMGLVWLFYGIFMRFSPVFHNPSGQRRPVGPTDPRPLKFSLALLWVFYPLSLPALGVPYDPGQFFMPP